VAVESTGSRGEAVCAAVAGDAVVGDAVVGDAVVGDAVESTGSGGEVLATACAEVAGDAVVGDAVDSTASPTTASPTTASPTTASPATAAQTASPREPVDSTATLICGTHPIASVNSGGQVSSVSLTIDSIYRVLLEVACW